MSTGARVGGVRPPGIPRESWLRRKTIKSEAARRVREVTDNRTNEPTPEQVEAAAKAIADCHNPGMFDRYPENWRVEARAALVAAQGAAPVPSSGVDEDKLAEVIAHSGTAWEREWSECLDGKADDPGPSAEYIARDVRAYLTGEKA